MPRCGIRSAQRADHHQHSGVSYASPDQVTVPRGAVAQFTGFPALQDGVIVPHANFTFTRLD